MLFFYYYLFISILMIFVTGMIIYNILGYLGRVNYLEWNLGVFVTFYIFLEVVKLYEGIDWVPKSVLITRGLSYYSVLVSTNLIGPRP